MLRAIEDNPTKRAKSQRELLQNLAAILDSVTNDHEPVIITRGRGKTPVVVVSLEDFASHEESRYLLQSPRNADRLLKSVAELDHHKLK